MPVVVVVAPRDGVISNTRFAISRGEPGNRYSKGMVAAEFTFCRHHTHGQPLTVEALSPFDRVSKGMAVAKFTLCNCGDTRVHSLVSSRRIRLVVRPRLCGVVWTLVPPCSSCGHFGWCKGLVAKSPDCFQASTWPRRRAERLSTTEQRMGLLRLSYYTP